jgi:hypothetical protein
MPAVLLLQKVYFSCYKFIQWSLLSNKRGPKADLLAVLLPPPNCRKLGLEHGLLQSLVGVLQAFRQLNMVYS